MCYVCVFVCGRRRGGGILADSLPLSTPPSTYLSIHLSIPPPPPPPLPRWCSDGWKDGPRVLTHSHAQTHTSAMCHYQFHLPLPVIPRSPLHLPTLDLFPLFFFFLFFFAFALTPFFSPTLPCPQPPPTLCVTTAGKKEKCTGRMKVQREGIKQTVKEEKIVKAGVCLERSDASIQHEPDSALMEYRGTAGGRSKKREKK